MVDTVDIIAHDSYRKLLAAKEALLEHVLPQKGSQGGTPQVSKSGGANPLPAYSEVETQGMLVFTAEAPVRDGGVDTETSEAAFIGMADMERRLVEAGVEKKQIPQIMKPAEGAPVIKFPSKRLLEKPDTYSLSFVNPDAVANESNSSRPPSTTPLERSRPTPNRSSTCTGPKRCPVTANTRRPALR